AHRISGVLRLRKIYRDWSRHAVARLVDAAASATTGSGPEARSRAGSDASPGSGACTARLAGTLRLRGRTRIDDTRRGRLRRCQKRQSPALRLLLKEKRNVVRVKAFDVDRQVAGRRVGIDPDWRLDILCHWEGKFARGSIVAHGTAALQLQKGCLRLVHIS